MTVVQAKINQDNFFAMLGNIFSNRGKVVNELIQNAERANASSVKLTLTETDVGHDLLVVDDGSGIQDMQSLLTISESEWDAGIEGKNPYGMGFYSTLFSCESIIVRSGEQELIANCKDIVGRKILEISQCEAVEGTQITLRNINDSLHSYLQTDSRTPDDHKVSKGYDIDIYLNGTLLTSERSKSYLEKCANYQSLSFEFGTLYSRRNAEYGHYIGYLQGASIVTDHDLYSGYVHIVHLNDDLGARMPDRHCLLDEEEVKTAIEKAVATQMKSFVQQDIETTPHDQLVQNNFKWSRALKWASDLLYQVEYLTSNEVFYARDEDMEILASSERSCVGKPITRKEIESKTLYYTPEYFGEESSIVAWYLHSLNDIMFVDWTVPDNHWLHKCEILDSKDLVVSLSTSNPRDQFGFANYRCFNVVPVDSITLSGPYGDVDTTDHAVAGESALYIPKSADVRHALKCHFSYVDEWETLMEAELENDVEMLGQMLARSFCENELDMLSHMLMTYRGFNFEELKDKKFSLHIDGDLKPVFALIQ
ncbi:ATP-binding protein [Vibrio tubiashii]|uniref:ATP-binding protein n=1 Tax=Vibrio tubiashii TaxID=29498 RepID=UPI001EFD77F9|nr:ATP-binding protein [Vibrio tubiashii]MCG9576046.1 ATP-binding protein [Vibrio tubiashii]